MTAAIIVSERDSVSGEGNIQHVFQSNLHIIESSWYTCHPGLAVFKKRGKFDPFKLATPGALVIMTDIAAPQKKRYFHFKPEHSRVVLYEHCLDSHVTTLRTQKDDSLNDRKR